MRRTYRLPNNLDIFCQSAHNAAFIYHEVFVDRVYQQHGISVADGDVIFDVGANIGMYLLLLNQLLSKATVLCFEPIPDIFETLLRNAARHNHLDLRLMKCGLSCATGSATFTYYPRSSANSTMYPEMSAENRRNYNQSVVNVLNGAGNVPLGRPLRALLTLVPPSAKRLIADLVRRHYLRGKKVDCPLRTISDVIDEHRLDCINLLKIDTESAEFDIVAGVRAEHWPRVRQVVMEVHSGEAQARNMADFLETAGFSVHCQQETADSASNWSLSARACRPRSPRATARRVALFGSDVGCRWLRHCAGRVRRARLFRTQSGSGPLTIHSALCAVSGGAVLRKEHWPSQWHVRVPVRGTPK